MVFVSCSKSETSNPYKDYLYTLNISASYPEGFEKYMRAGVKVVVENVDLGYVYNGYTNSEGLTSVTIPNGVYRVMISDRIDGSIFNSTIDKVKLVGNDVSLQVALKYSKAGSIVFKEIYCGGCPRLPIEGNYQVDKYIILHNNDSEVQYLDGLCFGTLDPYNSTASNVWTTIDPVTGETIMREFAPIALCVWQFGGNGTSFPLAPGQDAVVALNGAINHASQYPLSVNLNKQNYFVCYNNVYFTNTTYHPAPGNNIQQERYLNVPIKTGQASAYAFSMSSPTAVIFRPEGMTMEEYLRDPNSTIQKPGSSDIVTKVPWNWIIDGVEVFAGTSSSNSKRLSSVVDAGYISQTGTYLARSLMRKIDQEASTNAGYEILMDTNNSSNDFYETDKQSLREN